MEKPLSFLGKTRRLFMTVRGRLFLLLLVVILPTIIVQLYVYYDRLRVSRYMELESSLEIAQAVSKSFDRFMQEELKHARALGRLLIHPALLKPPDFKRFLSEFADDGFRHITILSPEGRVLASTNDMALDVKIDDRQYIQDIITGRDEVISDILRARTDGKPVFVMVSGTREKSGRLLGIIVMTFSLDKAKRFLDLDRPRGGDITIIDKNKRIVLRSPETPLTWEQRDISKKYTKLDEVLAGKEVSFITSATFDGSRRLCAMVPMKSAGWVVRSSRKEEDAIGTLSRIVYYNAGLFFLVVIASFFTSIRLSRKISDPIMGLREQSLSLKNGELPEMVSISGPIEIRELAQTFNIMAMEIRKARDTLELRVRERTEKLKQLSQKLVQEINQKKILNKRITDLLENERRAVAMYLHDDVGQIITTLKMDLDRIKMNFKDNRMIEDLNEAQNKTLQIMTGIRKMIQELRPGSLDTLGLIPSIANTLEKIRKSSGLTINLYTHNVPDDLGDDKKLTLFRTVQESLTNILKHAAAKNVSIQLFKTNGRLFLCIEDDGKGFNPEILKHNSFGLIFMKERVIQNGGTFQIESQEGKGTAVRVEIPEC